MLELKNVSFGVDADEGAKEIIRDVVMLLINIILIMYVS